MVITYVTMYWVMIIRKKTLLCSTLGNDHQKNKIYCVDPHSAVPLKDVGSEGSTYINANFIRVSTCITIRYSSLTYLSLGHHLFTSEGNIEEKVCQTHTKFCLCYSNL